uniref:Uncharacterized protein n=1 Tax=Aegilops tauschii subsp. strangulata TaxID=200361 RepID=A0A453HW24_AEGTS
RVVRCAKAHSRTNPSPQPAAATIFPPYFLVNTGAAPLPSPPSRSPRSSAVPFDEIHRLPRSISTPGREEVAGGGEPSSQGRCRRRRSAGRRRPEKEERRGCQPRRRIASPLLHCERCRCLCIHLAPPSWDEAHHGRAAVGAITSKELQSGGGEDA